MPIGGDSVDPRSKLLTPVFLESPGAAAARLELTVCMRENMCSSTGGTPIPEFAVAPCYTEAMMDEQQFRRASEQALDSLKRHLIEREEEEDAGFEIEEQNGVLNVVFDDPAGKFVITPNTPVRQIWISALSTSFKLDWDAEAKTFKLAKSGEQLTPLVDRLIQEHQEG